MNFKTKSRKLHAEKGIFKKIIKITIIFTFDRVNLHIRFSITYILWKFLSDCVKQRNIQDNLTAADMCLS